METNAPKEADALLQYVRNVENSLTVCCIVEGWTPILRDYDYFRRRTWINVSWAKWRQWVSDPELIKRMSDKMENLFSRFTMVRSDVSENVHWPNAGFKGITVVPESSCGPDAWMFFYSKNRQILSPRHLNSALRFLGKKIDADMPSRKPILDADRLGIAVKTLLANYEVLTGNKLRA